MAGKGTPVWVVHGWGGGVDGYRPLLNELNACGNRVLFLPSIRRGGTSQLREHTRYRSLGLQAEYLLQAIQNVGLDELILLGHSMGGAVARLVGSALYAQGKQVRVICLCSACVHPDNPPWLLARLLWKGVHDRRYAKLLADADLSLWEGVKLNAKAYIASNFPRAIREGWALGRHARYIFSATPPEMDVYYVGGERDKLFTPPRYRRAMASLPAQRWTLLDISHDPQYKPHEARLVATSLADRDLLQL